MTNLVFVAIPLAISMLISLMVWGLLKYAIGLRGYALLIVPAILFVAASILMFRYFLPPDF
jgi:hypothetical protein